MINLRFARALSAFFLFGFALLLSACASLTQSSRSVPESEAGRRYLAYAGAQNDNTSSFQGASFASAPWLKPSPFTEVPTASLGLSQGDKTTGEALDIFDSGALGAFSEPPVTEVRYFDRETFVPGRNVWNELALGLKLSVPLQKRRVKEALALYSHNQSYFDRISKNGAPFFYYLIETAKRNQLPLELVLLAAVESDFDPFALSRSGALGMWQFMPVTASWFGIEHNWWYEGRRDVLFSTHKAFHYIRLLHERLGDWELAMAGYNSGGSRVMRAVEYNRAHHRSTDYFSLSLPRETENYVPRVLALAEIIRHPSRYGIELPYIPYTPTFAIFRYHGQLSLPHMAKNTGISIEVLATLNSGYSQNYTSPVGAHVLMVPYSHYYEACEYLEKLSNRAFSLPTYQLFVATNKEKVTEVANLSGTSLETLASLNDPENLVARKFRILLITTNQSDESSRLQALYKERMRRYAKVMHHVVNKRIYVVRGGDTLWGIARTASVPVDKLRGWNGLSGDQIFPGMRLHLSNPRTVKVMPSVNTAINAHSAFRTVRHHTKAGDSWESIASRWNVNPNELRQWNEGLSLSSGKVQKFQVDTKHIAGY